MVVKKIGFLGIGLMGEPMARNLLRAGFEVTVWNRTRGKAEHLRAEGAVVVDRIAEAAEDADAVVTMVADGEAVESILLEGELREAMRPGAIFIDMSSVAPEMAKCHADLMRERGVAALDAPVSGGTRGAEEGSLAIMVGGDQMTFEACRALFDALGRATLVGSAGSGQLAKLCNQIIVAVTIGAVSEAILLAERGGANAEAVREALGGGFADSRILREHGRRMIGRDFAPGGVVRNQVKDLRHALDAAERCGLNLPITSLVLERFEALAARAGGTELDHSALILELGGEA